VTLPWHHDVKKQFPFIASAEDHEVIRGLRDHCKLWGQSGGGAVLKWGPDLFATTGTMKIHDWYVMAGAVGVYVLQQCTGLSTEVKDALCRLCLAIEHMTLKNTKKADLAARQEELNGAIAALYPLLPVHVIGTMVLEQVMHWREQVDLAGMTHAHGTLDVEGYMVFFKTLCQSRKNVPAGIAKLVHISECAYLWGLEALCQKEEDEGSPAQGTEVVTASRGKRTKTASPESSSYADGLLGLVTKGDEVQRTHLLLHQYFDAFRAWLRVRGNKKKDFPALKGFRPPGADGRPRDQTADEGVLANAATRITLHRSVVVRGVTFCTRRRAEAMSTDNSAVSAPWTDARGQPSTIYGRIQHIMSVRLPGEIRRVALHVNWFSHTADLLEVIPILKANSATLNKLYPVLWASDVYAQNIAIWPRDLRRPGGEEFLCVWRESEARPLPPSQQSV
jgi:hypothetical protein